MARASIGGHWIEASVAMGAHRPTIAALRSLHALPAPWCRSRKRLGRVR
jgi:hypothetical protein